MCSPGTWWIIWMHRSIIQLSIRGATKMTRLANGGKDRTIDFRFYFSLHFIVCSGMVGELVHNDVELGASPLFMTVDRVPIIQYIAMPTPTGSRFVFRAPKLSYTDNVYLLPFDSMVWYCLVLLVVITAIFLCFAVALEWKYSLVDSKNVVSVVRASCIIHLKPVRTSFSWPKIRMEMVQFYDQKSVTFSSSFSVRHANRVHRWCHEAQPLASSWLWRSPYWCFSTPVTLRILLLCCSRHRRASRHSKICTNHDWKLEWTTPYSIGIFSR